MISIDDPDVWKSPGNENAYIVFGKPNMDGMGGGGMADDFKPPVNLEGAEKPNVEEAVEGAQ